MQGNAFSLMDAGENPRKRSSARTRRSCRSIRRCCLNFPSLPSLSALLRRAYIEVANRSR
jgi:hypothetical protein